MARGRVWTGGDALEIGLVDQLGGLREAVEVARTRGGLSKDAPVLPGSAGLTAGPTRPCPKNSDDPRALLTASWPTLADLPTALGVLDESALRMDPIRLR